MIEKLAELTTDLSLDIVKSNLKDVHDSRKIKNDIIEFVQNRQELILKDDNNDIDYQGYLDYIRADMLDDIKRYICTVDYDEAKNIKRMILAKASTYERNKGYYGGIIQFITENCINVVKEYYKGKLDGNFQLLAHITVHSIIDSIDSKIDTIDEKVEIIKSTIEKREENRKTDSMMLYQQLTRIEDMISNDSKITKETHNNGFFLAYCEQDKHIADLKEWLDNNSIKYDSCCYIDEYTEEEDVICHLGMKQVLVLLIGKAFLRNVHCVYGLAELAKNEDYNGWILPVVIDKSIFNTRNRAQCISYWEARESELRTTVEGLEKVQHAYNLVSDELVKYERIAQSIDEFIVWIIKHSYTMNTIKETIKKKQK